jgi:predicted RNase H-like HicB family nuclease
MRKVMIEVVIEKDKHGYFAYCPSLQGCYTQGTAYEEVIHNIKDAVRLHLEDRRASHHDLPSTESISVTTLEMVV